MENDKLYRTDPNIQYSNDFEYRDALRKILCMKSIEEIDQDIDEVTRDEQDYDMDAATKSLDYVYDNTCKNPLFQELYDSAASKMISMDRSIGLSVLFSYDYMGLFHYCLCSYFDEPASFDEKNEAYVALKKKLG
jgi:hypothetical protein